MRLKLPSNIEYFLKLKVKDGTYKSMEDAVNTALNTALYYNFFNIDLGHTKSLSFGYYTFKDSDIPEEFTFPKFKKPLVSIVIPVFNQYSYTLKCLWSVLQYAGDVTYEVIIADDNSTDKTKDIQKYIHNIKVSRNKENLGYIKNCNNAAKLAVGKFIYFMNNDTIAQPDWLKELVNTFELKKDAGVVGSKVILPNFRMQECGVYMFSDKFFSDHNSDPTNSMHNYLREADYVSGCSLMTYRKLFNEIGGFDELFSPAYSDDPDYCLSARKKGYKTYVQPKSKILHYENTSYKTKANKLAKESRMKLINKWKDYFDTRSEFKIHKLPFSGKTRPVTLLMIDSFMPEFDKHAGAKTIYQYIELFTSKGICLKYCALNNYEHQEPYYSILSDMGVQIIDRNNIMRYLQKMGEHIDYILLSRPETAKVFLDDYYKKFKAKILYYGADLHHLRMQRELENDKTKNKTEREEFKKKIIQMKKLEKSILKFVDYSYYPSLIEEEYIKKNFKTQNVTTITPYLYKIEDMPQHADFKNSKDLIFVGSSHGPNKTGLLWFIKNVFPLVVKKIPDIKLHIVGSTIADEIKRKANNNIKITGFLTDEELQEMYMKTKITIVPLLYGAGIKGKVVNSLFMSTPVVTTSIGAEGIETKYGNIYVHDNPKDFAEQVIKLYTDENLWNSDINGYANIIKNEYSFEKAWEVFSKQIDIKPRKND